MGVQIPALRGFPLDEEQLAVLGEIAALSALVEAVLDGIICRLVTEDRDAISPLVAGQPFGWLLRALKELLPRAGEYSKELSTWSATLKQPMEERNRLIHSIWLLRLDQLPGATLGKRPRRWGNNEAHFESAERMAVVRDELAAAYQIGLKIAHGMTASTTEDIPVRLTES